MNKLYQLTYSQKNIWYTEKIYPGTSIGNISGTLRVHNKIDISLLKKAINIFVKENDGMRIRVIEKNKEPFQYIADFSEVEIDVIDFSNNSMEDLYKWEEKETKTLMEIIDNPLFVFKILKIDDNNYGIYNKIHHLIGDAWNMSLSGNQIMDIYFDIENDVYQEKQRPSYIEHIEKEQEYEGSEKYQKDREYWLNKYNYAPEVTIIKPRVNDKKSTKASRKTFILPGKLTKKLYEHAKTAKTSVFSMYMAALAMYINRTTNKEELNLGTVFLNRTDVKEKNTTGMFVTTVPVNLIINNENNFDEFCKQVTVEMMSIMRHQKYPFSILQEEIREKYNIDEVLYDIILSYQNAKFVKEKVDVTTRWHFAGYQTHSLMININDRDTEQKLIIDYDYLESLFCEKEIEFMNDHIVRILWHALDNPAKPIKYLEMVCEKEKNKILNEFNNTDFNYDRQKTISELFSESVKNNGDRIAVEFKNKTITYKELGILSNKVANTLSSKGVKRGDIVGVFLPRNENLIVAIMGIIKSGATYLPIDTAYPLDRVRYMVEDSKLTYIVTDVEDDYKIEGNVSTVNIEECLSNGTEESINNINTAEDLLYIMYTSGSTGNPKAVMIRHRNVNNYINAVRKFMDYEDYQNVLCVTTMSFDIFVFELFPTLILGLKLVLADEEEQKVSEKLVALIKNKSIDKILTTPSRMQLIISNDEGKEALKNVKEIALGGEPFPKSLLISLKELTRAKLLNLYGPTETTVYSTAKDLTTGKDVNIGNPIINTQVYILDNNFNLLPIGMQGEIYIGGDGVGAGYYNKEELTEEKFIDNPFGPGKIYRTGDMGRWYSKGEIECLGRIDNQVKIRGHRIELGEIETRISEYEDVSETVVVAKDGEEGRKFLCAYITGDKEKINISGLKKYLLTKLPNYMMPAYFIQIEKIPLTPNGKINKKLLPEIGEQMTQNDSYVAPGNETENVFVKIWEELLKVKGIGVQDDFFEMGGDSLLIIQLQVKALAYGFNFTTQDIYRHRTIRDLCEFLLSNKNADMTEFKKDIRKKTFFGLMNKQFLNKPGKVLITGTTGYLGIHILNEMIANSDKKIICLVRGENREEAIKRLDKNLKYYFNKNYEQIRERVEVIAGDVSKKDFALDETTYNNLVNEVSEVINSAASVKYYGNYEDSYKANVLTVRNLIDFSILANCRLNHISTIGVSGQFLVTQTEKNPVFSEDTLYIGQNYAESIYIRSKYEAEKLIFDIGDKGILSATVLRVGNLTGRFEDGLFQSNIKENAFYNILKSIISLRAVPKSMIDQKMEFTPVDLCAKAIVKIISKSETINEVFHVYNSNIINVKQLISILKKIGINVAIISNEEFKNHIEELYHKNKSGLIEGLINDMDMGKNLTFNSNVIVKSKKSCKWLKANNFKWLKIDKKYIEKILKYIRCDEN